jgi:hypothetical protein
LPVITIQITVPEGTQVVVNPEADVSASTSPARDSVERYFRHFLSDNGRRLYAAAARLEDFSGPGYTLGDIAANLSIDYPSAQSFHRTSGRSARRWHDETGTDAPIQLLGISYEWVEAEHGMRSRYRLPDGVAPMLLRFH